MMIPPKMLTEELQTGNASGYGYVSTPDSSSKGTLDVNTEGDAIVWTNLNLKSGQTLTTYINRVNVSDRAQAYDWEVRVGSTEEVGSTADVAQLLISAIQKRSDQHLELIVTDAAEDGVIFSIDEKRLSRCK